MNLQLSLILQMEKVVFFEKNKPLDKNFEKIFKSNK